MGVSSTLEDQGALLVHDPAVTGDENVVASPQLPLRRLPPDLADGFDHVGIGRHDPGLAEAELATIRVAREAPPIAQVVVGDVPIPSPAPQNPAPSRVMTTVIE